MPWKTTTTMSLRTEFVMLAQQKKINFSELCRRFGLSRKTGYKWLKRQAQSGAEGLADRSRRPKHSPRQIAAALEKQVVVLRQQHPAWGPRKLRRRLADQGGKNLPATSTFAAVLRRQGLLLTLAENRPGPWQRFERAAPNELWQMDFKGHVPCRDGRCHPLTVLDDHSRYALTLAACADERGTTVQAILTQTFRRYGLPWQMLMDNGAPWGDDRDTPHTWLTVWLLRLGIAISHGRPYHPQTQGKEERFHRTLKAELLGTELAWPLAHCQSHFDQWRQLYNEERPHEALALAVPARRYQPSPRPFPEVLPPVEYSPQDEVRRVQAEGWISFHGRPYRLSKAFKGQPVALRPTTEDGHYDIFFGRHRITQINLHQNPATP
jgi:transposase InsO family protein